MTDESHIYNLDYVADAQRHTRAERGGKSRHTTERIWRGGSALRNDRYDDFSDNFSFYEYDNG